MAEHGTFYWNELVTADQKKSGDFYCALLGWDRREMGAGPFGTYTLFIQNDKDVAGMMNPTSDYSRTKPPWWSAYIAVDNVYSRASQVEELGGKLVEPVVEIPDVGRACTVADPMGAFICLMTPVQTSSSDEKASAPAHGTFMWNHLVTTDQQKSGEFYGQLLGWIRSEVNAGSFGIYTLFQQNSVDVAGMMNPTIDFTRSRPSQWYAYIAVDDVDACTAHAEQLGGKLIEPPHEIPGVGRACLITDPVGAPITLMTPVARQP
jgi:uncharacterized protein